MTITPKRNFGDLGEKLAAKYLKDKGYQILDTNFQNNLGRRLGEIDIIAKDTAKNELVFAEVKTRELSKYGDTLPEENITRGKMIRLAKIAGAYIRLKRLEDMDYRFDALSVWLDALSKKAKIKHIESL
ncbi:MAG: putative endonuclease [Patescibacteria group bacterium]|nr:putative endonuclease [Patescibacteria group bacterium]